MGLRFRKSFKIAPGVRWNIGTRSSSFSFGPRSFGLNVGSRGMSARASIKGSGISVHQVLTTSKVTRKQADLGAQVDGICLGVLPDGQLGIHDGETLHPISPDLMNAIRSQQRAKVEDWLQNLCRLENEQIERIRTIHLSTPSPQHVRAFEPLAFENDPPTAPTLRRLGLLSRFLRRYRDAVLLENSKIVTEYEERLRNWSRSKQDHETEQGRRQEIFIRRNEGTEAMSTFLSDYLPGLDWPRETEVSFDILEDGTAVVLDVDLPEVEDVPAKEATVVGRSLRLTYKQRTETSVRRDYMQHVHGVGLRLTGEVFSFFPHVRRVLISGYSQRVDQTTGRTEDHYLFSVKVNREQWEQVDFDNLDRLDPIVALGRFEIRRKMTKTGIFSPIQPFEA